MPVRNAKIITIKPLPLLEHINKLIDFCESKDDAAADLLESIKLIKEHYIEAANLVRVQTFATVYGLRRFGKPVNRQSVYEKIERGSLPEINIDEVIFIDKSLIP